MAEANRQLARQPSSELVANLLQKKRSEIERVIPKHLNPERLLRVAISAITRSPKLQVADVPSLVRSIMAGAILGLEIDVNGEAYLVPFYSSRRKVYEAQLLVGYKGLIKLGRQSREIESIHAGLVLPGDEFDFEEGDKAFVHHHRAMRSRDDLAKAIEQKADPNKLAIAWYTATHMKGARYPQVRVLDQYEVEVTRLRSRAKDEGPWITDYDAMGLKTVIRRAAKTWPLSPNLSRAVETEDRAERAAEGSTIPMTDLFPEMDGIVDVTPQAGETELDAKGGTVEKLADKLVAQKAEAVKAAEAAKPDPKKGKEEPGADG